MHKGDSRWQGARSKPDQHCKVTVAGRSKPVTCREKEGNVQETPQELKQVTDLGSSTAPVHSETTSSSLYIEGVLYNPRWCEHANAHTTEGS